MIANIFVGICIIICIAAAVFAWWIENGPDQENSVTSEEQPQTAPAKAETAKSKTKRKQKR